MPAKQSPKPRVLLVEDDPALRKLIQKILKRRGFDVVETDNGRDGLRLARTRNPNLILLDWVLKKGPNGVEICAKLKNIPETRSIPVVILTGAKVEFSDELAALSNGADLYLTKQAILGSAAQTTRFFKYVQSLLARPFKTHRQRGRPSLEPEIRIDLPDHTVAVGKEIIVNLPTKLFDLLYVLAQKFPRIVSRSQLVSQVWRNGVRDREVDVAVCRLKTRVEKSEATVIESIVGRGYRLRARPFLIQ